MPAASRRRLPGVRGLLILAWSSLPAIAFAWTEWYTVQWAIARWARTRFADIPGDTVDSAFTAAA